MPPLAVLIPAHDEAGWIVACLNAVFASQGVAGVVIVAANGCRDDTVAHARGAAAQARGWTLQVLDLPEAGKPGALMAAEAAAPEGATLVYLDADVTLHPDLLAQIATALSDPAPRYATGSPVVTARGWLSRAYARFWTRLPFVAQGAPGFGLFAVNAAGRARWGAWPGIISDDTFARLHFTPAERLRLPGRYDWPMIEGFAPLVRVRRRQNLGVDEVRALFPALIANEDADPPGTAWLLRRALRDPVAFGVYSAVKLAARRGWFAKAGQPVWARGR